MYIWCFLICVRILQLRAWMFIMHLFSRNCSHLWSRLSWSFAFILKCQYEKVSHGCPRIFLLRFSILIKVIVWRNSSEVITFSTLYFLFIKELAWRGIFTHLFSFIMIFSSHWNANVDRVLICLHSLHYQGLLCSPALVTLWQLQQLSLILHRWVTGLRACSTTVHLICLVIYVTRNTCGSDICVWDIAKLQGCTSLLPSN